MSYSLNYFLFLALIMTVMNRSREVMWWLGRWLKRNVFETMKKSFKRSMKPFQPNYKTAVLKKGFKYKKRKKEYKRQQLPVEITIH